MTTFVVVAHVEASPARREEIETELHRLSDATRLESGCLHYQICRDLGTEGGRWLIYETWQSETHFRAHLDTSHLRRFKHDVLSSEDVMRADKLVKI